MKNYRCSNLEHPGMYPGLLTVRCLAARCEVSVGTVYNWIDRGAVTATRLDRTWRMWGPTVAVELADEYDVGAFDLPSFSIGSAGYVDTPTVAAWLGVSEPTARQMARGGVLPSVRVGPVYRFHWPTLLAALVTPPGPRVARSPEPEVSRALPGYAP